MHITTLHGVVLVRPLISVATGTVAVDRDTDLEAAKGSLPPTSIVSDGRKRILDSKRLNPLLNVRKGVERVLAKAGSPFLGATMVPEAKLADVEAQIKELEAEFYLALDTLCDGLDDAYLEWEQQNPDWSSLIAKNRMPAHELKSRCRFGVAYFKAQAPAHDPGGRFKAAVSEAVPAVLADVATEAAKVYASHIEGRDRATQKAITPIKRLLEKLESFSMLDPRVSPSVKGFRAVLATLPRHGPLKDAEFSALAGLIHQLQDPEELLAHGEQLFANQKAPAQPSLLASIDDEADEDACNDDELEDDTPAMLPATPPRPPSAAYPRTTPWSTALI